jgi:predicted TIM-barrel fold metal-dependent hydrolase
MSAHGKETMTDADERGDGLSRRAFTAGVAVTALGAGISGQSAAMAIASQHRKGRTMAIGKIDTHQHYFPKVYVDAVGLDALAAQMPNKKAPEWSPERAIAMMDANGIAEGIVSVSSGPAIPDAPTLLRKCNDSGAALRQSHPGRFGLFASLPLPDIDASLKEVAYCLDQLKVDGFIIFTSYDGHYLGEDMFAPLFDELDRRGAIAFIHPNEPAYQIPKIAPASVLEFPFETTRTATSLILSGAMSRYRRMRFILSHAGGTLPYLVPRVSLSISMIPGAAERVGDVPAAFQAFYYDTALSAGVSTLTALSLIAKPDHILFGTDFPMAPLTAITHFGEELERLNIAGLKRSDIYRDNAARLLGREPGVAAAA